MSKEQAPTAVHCKRLPGIIGSLPDRGLPHPLTEQFFQCTGRTAVARRKSNMLHLAARAGQRLKTGSAPRRHQGTFAGWKTVSGSS